MNILNQSADGAVIIKRIDAWACRHSIDKPIETSFGIMMNRPAVFVRIEDEEGCFGWGEIFANWPAAGAEHRVNLLMCDIAEFVTKGTIHHPSELYYQLEEATAICALQCGEWGPFRQVIAGLDIAIWDLFAHQAGKPLRKYINPLAADNVQAYASGLSVHCAESEMDTARAAGFNVFKLKVGFDLDADIDALVQQVSNLASHERLCVDANQAWDVDTALKFMERTEALDLQWIEEPIRVDALFSDWQKLAGQTTTRLAGGENIAGFDAFEQVINTGTLAVLQPDIVKWGGVTGCLKVGKAALDASKLYCPHFLGGGIGLSASAELLAAVGGDGLLEVDVNENPLRETFRSTTEAVSQGRYYFDERVGLGISRLPIELENCVTLHRTWVK